MEEGAILSWQFTIRSPSRVSHKVSDYRMRWSGVLGRQYTQCTLAPGLHEVSGHLGLAVYTMYSVTRITWRERLSSTGSAQFVLSHLDRMRWAVILGWQCTHCTSTPPTGSHEVSSRLELAMYTMYSVTWVVWSKPSWAGGVHKILCHLDRMRWAAVLGGHCIQCTLSPGSHEVASLLELAMHTIYSVTQMSTMSPGSHEVASLLELAMYTIYSVTQMSTMSPGSHEVSGYLGLSVSGEDPLLIPSHAAVLLFCHEVWNQDGSWLIDWATQQGCSLLRLHVAVTWSLQSVTSFPEIYHFVNL